LDKQTDVRRLFWIVIAAIALYVVLDAIAQSLPPYYSPIRDAESDLAVGPYGYIMAINFLNRGILSLVFLYALSKAVRADTGAVGGFRTGMYVFGVWAVGAILLAFFPTDVPATPVSWHGAIHLIVAALAFLGGSFGALMLSLQFSKSEALRKAKTPALVIAVLSVVFLFVGFGTIAGPIGGLTERMFLGSVLLWQLVVSFHLARRQVAGQ
jgi:hypothetical membrane protein